MKRFHGGGVSGVIDFSVNTNPLGPPPVVEEAVAWCIRHRVYTLYPDSNYEELRRAISLFYNVKREHIVPCNGASEALSLAVIVLRPRTLTVIQPSYGDYDLLCRALRIKCIDFYMNEVGDTFNLNIEDLLDRVRSLEDPLLVLTNPNNPTGIVVEPEIVEQIVLDLKGKARVLLDEVYSELSGYKGFMGREDLDNVIVVRSFTKTLSIPGLRVGLLYSPNMDIVRRIDMARPTWNISSIAECTLRRILSSHSHELWRFIDYSREYIAGEKRFLTNSLRSLGYKVYDSKTNFVLLRHDWIDATSLRNTLLDRYGILVRPAHTFKGLTRYHTRIGVKRRRENELLVKALGELVKSS